jgi:hypothetical protein
LKVRAHATPSECGAEAEREPQTTGGKGFLSNWIGYHVQLCSDFTRTPSNVAAPMERSKTEPRPLAEVTRHEDIDPWNEFLSESSEELQSLQQDAPADQHCG